MTDAAVGDPDYLHDNLIAHDWGTYSNSGILSEACVELLNQDTYQSVLDTVIHEASAHNCALLVEAITNVSDPDALTFVSVALHDFLSVDNEDISVRPDERMAILLSIGASHVVLALQHCLHSPEPAIKMATTMAMARIYTHLLADPVYHPQFWKAAVAFMMSLVSGRRHHLIGEDPRGLEIPFSAWGVLFEDRELRDVFVHQDGLAHVATLLSYVPQHQLTSLSYRAVYAVWLLSFSPVARTALAQGPDSPHVIDTIGSITACLKHPREKVVRIALRVLLNLMLDKSCVITLLADGVLDLLAALKYRTWADDDIEEIVAELNAKCTNAVINLSTWEVYKDELESGQLRRTPVHTNAEFWKRNAKRLLDSMDELHKLVELTVTTTDQTTLLVGCEDLIQFLNHCQHGRRVLNAIPELRAQLLVLVGSENKELAGSALNLLQRLIVGVQLEE